MQVLAGSLELRLGTEIGHVDDQGVALPVPPRVSPPQADGQREVRTAVHRNHSLPPLALPCVIEDRYSARRLHELKGKAGGTTEVRKARAHATLPQASVFGSVGAIDGAGQ